MKGTVKSIQADKGWGFIRGEDGTEYFFHYSALKNTRIDALRKGDAVEFEDSEGSKGPRAEDVFVENQ